MHIISWTMLWQCRANSCSPCAMQAEVDGLRGDVAQLFLALKAAETRHQQELAGVIVDAAQHQTKVSVAPTVSLARGSPTDFQRQCLVTMHNLLDASIA